MHMVLHMLIPAIVALICFRNDWKKGYGVMMATMLVDIDHLLASPVYDPGRCSIGFHPLHGSVPIAVYAMCCVTPKLRYVGLGLIIHMILDSLDCQLTNGVWFV